MASRTKRPANKGAGTKGKGEGTDRVEMAALAEYLAHGAVSELVVVEVHKGTYRLEALLTWKPRRSVLTAARGGERIFRSVDTVVTFFKHIGVGRTSIRMELKT